MTRFSTIAFKKESQIFRGSELEHCLDNLIITLKASNAILQIELFIPRNGLVKILEHIFKVSHCNLSREQVKISLRHVVKKLIH